MGTKARSRRYLDTVELFSVETVNNDYGTEDSTEVSIGEFGANVEVMTGSRFEQYKRFGYTSPVIVKMYAVDVSFQVVKWNGKRLQVKSVNQDKANIEKIIIYADIINEEFS